VAGRALGARLKTADQQAAGNIFRSRLVIFATRVKKKGTDLPASAFPNYLTKEMSDEVKADGFSRTSQNLQQNWLTPVP
jgi:hypothetical protein